MIIQVDKEGKKLIDLFCDMALKAGGLPNLKQVNTMLDAVVMIGAPGPELNQPQKQMESER